jgi:hypothetical protein
MAKFTAPIPKDKIGESFVWRDWFQRLSDKVFGSVASQDAHNVDITGGAISNTSITGGSITGLNAPLPIDSGGTGHVTANSAVNALLPSQVSNTGKFLKTDGTNTSWATAGSGTVTSIGGTGTVSGITLSGTVTTAGNLTLGGTLSLTSGNVTTALGYTPYNSTNPSGYITSSGSCASAVNLFGGTLTTSSYTLASSNNLIALQSSAGNGVFVNGSGASFSGSSDNAISLGTSGYRWSALYVAGTFGWGGYSIAAPSGSTSTYLRNDGTWASISGGTGTVTSVSGTGTVSGLTLSGTVTTSGSLTLGGALTLTSSNVTTALGYTPYSNTNPSGYITSSGSCAYATNAGYATSAGSASSATTASTATSATYASYLGSYSDYYWARTFPCDTGTANAAGSGINFNCLITGYRFRGTSNIVYIEPVSDRRLKENIQPEVLGLEFINALLPVTYNMIGQERKAHGFIAQDFDSLISDVQDSLKIEHEDGIKGIDYISLIGPLVKAVQELSAEVSSLKSKQT